MRELKFRAWDKEDNVMLDVDGITQFNGEPVVWSNALGKNNDVRVLMQYTGLKDKNGKEIYEGDIVKSLYRLGEEMRHLPSDKEDPFIRVGKIEYINAEFCLNSTMLSLHKELEVTGNIYENPDLLTQEK